MSHSRFSNRRDAKTRPSAAEAALTVAAGAAAVAILLSMLRQGTPIRALGHEPHTFPPNQRLLAEAKEPRLPTTPKASAERGQWARSPAQLTAQGWREVLWRVKDEIAEDRVMIVAGGVTFYALLSLFPMLAAFVALWGLFSDPAGVFALTDGLRGAVPEQMLVLIADRLDALVTTQDNTLTLASVIALAAAFWSANGGIKGLIEAMNVAYDEREERSFLRLNLVAMSMTLSGMVLVGLLLAVGAVLPAVLPEDPRAGWGSTLLVWARWPVLALCLIGAFSVLYRFGPDRRAAKWRWITPGAVFAAVGLLGMTLAFSVYTTSFTDMDATYGSLGAVVAVILWLWLAAIVVIVGAELNAETEHQTAHDSTIGPDRPLGLRDAEMADRVAPPLS